MNPIRHDAPAVGMADLHIAILNDPQFTRDDVVAVNGMTPGQLKGILDRGEVRPQEASPGSGRRQMFTGGDILRIATTKHVNEIGFPNKWAYLVADLVVRRAQFRLGNCDVNAGRGKLSICTYPIRNGSDWANVQIWSDETAPKLPLRYQILEVDRLIDETLAKLQALINEEDIPSFDIAEPEVEPSPFSPENDFFRAWQKDDKGRDLLVGLDYTETQEFLRLSDLNILDRSQIPDEHGREQILMTREEHRKLRELHERHEAARIRRVGQEIAERLQQGE